MIPYVYIYIYTYILITMGFVADFAHTIMATKLFVCLIISEMCSFKACFKIVCILLYT